MENGPNLLSFWPTVLEMAVWGLSLPHNLVKDKAYLALVNFIRGTYYAYDSNTCSLFVSAMLPVKACEKDKIWLRNVKNSSLTKKC